VSTLLATLERRAREHPEREAFVFAGRPHGYGELWAGAGRCASGLVGHGVAPGDRVVLALPNGPDFFAAFYGTLRAGGIAVPLFPGSGAGRLAAAAQRSGAEVVVTAGEGEPERRAQSPRAWAPRDRAPRALSVAALAAAAARRLPPAPGLDDVAYIQYTSGSTGEPKGVQVRHADVMANVRQMVQGMKITPREVFVSWLPVHHDMGLVLMTMVPFHLGARLVLLPAGLRQPRSWLAAIADHGGTFTAAPDFAYRVCLRTVRDPGGYDLGTVRVALNAAEPVRAATLRACAERFGRADVMVPGYGLAEATVGVSMWPPGTPVKVDGRGFPSVGRGFPGVELAILADRGELAAPGETGEILVRSPANTIGYWDDPEATAGLFWGAGYLRTGDLGYLDGDGDLFVVGRSKNLIIQAGRNIAPAEVEAVLDALPFARRSAAVGIDRGGPEGEQIYAFVELAARAARSEPNFREMAVQAVAEIRAELGLGPGRLYLAKPRTVPLTETGKIRHAELRERYANGSLAASGQLLFPKY